MNKVGSLASGRVMLSLALKRYFEPLRLPIQPLVTSSPYTQGLTLLSHHCIGPPGTGLLIFRNMPPLLPRKIPRTASVFQVRDFVLPHVSTGSASSLKFNEATCRFTCVTACCFANWKLTTPCYQDAAPLSYRSVRTIPRTVLEPVRPNSCYCIRTSSLIIDFGEKRKSS